MQPPDDLQLRLSVAENAIRSERSSRNMAEARAEQAERAKNAAENAETNLATDLEVEKQNRRTIEKQRDAAKASADALSTETQRRVERIRLNCSAGRRRTYPAPDGSNRNFTIAWDSTHVDVIPRALVNEIQAR